MRLYAELAPWFHLVTDPRSYQGEAAHIVRIVEDLCDGPAKTLLELGSGGGCNASHLKRRFACTLSDLSVEMLKVSQTLNPDCEHVEGDMRTLRLERRFDVVLVHDAIQYMTTEADLAAAIGAVAAHLRPGGVALLIPDAVTETYQPGTRHGGTDGTDGRGLRYLEWTHDVASGATTAEVDYVFLIREPGRPLRMELDHHTFGLFPHGTWLRLIRASGLASADVALEDPYKGQHVIFAARAPVSERPSIG